MLTNLEFSNFLQTIASKYDLSRAEKEAMILALEGSDITAIAQQLEVRPSAIRQRLSQVYQKFEIEGRGPVKLTKLQQMLLSQFQEYQPENSLTSSSSQDSISQECIHLDEAPAATVFYGRTEELATLKKWIVADECQLIALLGMGGIGKSCLAAKLVQQIQDNFDYVIWRSLRYAPTLPEFLADLFEVLSPEEKIEISEQTGRQISQLMKYLQSFRCLLIIDDVEAIMESQKLAGYYSKGYEAYRDLFQRIGESSHRSCLLLNSREKPIEIALLEGLSLPVRSLKISWLLTADAHNIVTSAGINSSQEDLTKLIQQYRGNPAVLKIMATTIQELFNRDLAQYLHSNELFIGDILGEMLATQFQRLSEGERKVIYWLALNNKPLSLNEMKSQVLFHRDSSEILGIIESLLRRSLIEKSTESDEIQFSLLPIVIKYVIDQFKQIICQIVTSKNPQNLENLGLVKEELLREIQSMDKLEDIDTNQSSILFNRIAKILVRIGYHRYIDQDFGSAEFYFRLAIEFQPNRASAHYNLGSIYWELALINKYKRTEYFDKAKKHYDVAAKSNKKASYAAINNLAKLEILDGNYQKAIELIDSILNLVEDENIKASLYKNLGCAYYELNRSDKAEEYLGLSLELKDSHPEILEVLKQMRQEKSKTKSKYREYLPNQKKGRGKIGRLCPDFMYPDLPASIVA